MVQRPRPKARVTVTSASGATMAKVDDMASKSRRLASLAVRFSAKRLCSIMAKPLSAACASSVTTSTIAAVSCLLFLERLAIDAEDEILIGGELAVEDDGAVGERAFGAALEIIFRHADVAQARRQFHA